MTNNNELNLPVDEKSLTKETQEIIGIVRDYINRAKKSGRKFPFIQEKKSNQDLLALGYLRDTLSLPFKDGNDVYAFGIYCFSMIRYFGITVLHDRYIVLFLEYLQFNQDDRYYDLSNYLFPKWSKLKGRFSKASYEGQPYHEKVYKKLICLGFKRRFDDVDKAFDLLKQNFSFIDPTHKERDEMIALIDGKLIGELAEHICGFYFKISRLSFQKARQKSNKFINR